MSTAVEEDAAAVGAQGAGDAVDQGGLAGAVGADESEALARLHVKVTPVERGEAAEALDHAVDLEEGAGHR